MSAYSVVVPSSSSSRHSRTPGNNKRIGTALKARTGTYGDIGDNLYDGLSVRAQSSTFRPLFNDQVTTPIDTFSPQQQQQQQRRYTSNNTSRRNSSNALAGLFGRKNNNVNNGNRYNSANSNNNNNGRRLSNSGGRTNSIYDLYSRNSNNYNSNGRRASTSNSKNKVPFGGSGARRTGSVTSRPGRKGVFGGGLGTRSNNGAALNPQVARNSGVRLSDVGKVRRNELRYIMRYQYKCVIVALFLRTCISFLVSFPPEIVGTRTLSSGGIAEATAKGERQAAEGKLSETSSRAETSSSRREASPEGGRTATDSVLSETSS